MLGLININKPVGYTSSDAVVKIRGILRRHYGIKDIKVGHLGTLDKGGSGVLPIVIGKATKLFDYFSASKKKYRAEFVFGIETDTLDSYGKITAENHNIITRERIEAELNSFLGDIEQVPPKYSRVSVDGVRGYRAMRSGQNIEMPLKNITIYDIDIIDFENNRLILDVECSGGTYIRSLCRDLAYSLKTVAYMSFIIRLSTKGLNIEDSITIDEFEDDIERNTQSIEDILIDIPRVDITFKKTILTGLSVEPVGKSGDYLGIIDGDIYGICRDGDNSIETLINLYEYEKHLKTDKI